MNADQIHSLAMQGQPMGMARKAIPLPAQQAHAAAQARFNAPVNASKAYVSKTPYTALQATQRHAEAKAKLARTCPKSTSDYRATLHNGGGTSSLYLGGR